MSESIENLPPERVNLLNPAMAFGAFKEAKDEFIALRGLYISELEYEKALGKGERPQVPANYMSSRSRLELVKDAAQTLKRSVRYLKKVLNLPENDSLASEQRKTMEQAIEDLPSTVEFTK